MQLSIMTLFDHLPESKIQRAVSSVVYMSVTAAMVCLIGMDTHVASRTFCRKRNVWPQCTSLTVRLTLATLQHQQGTPSQILLLNEVSAACWPPKLYNFIQAHLSLKHIQFSMISAVMVLKIGFFDHRKCTPTS